MKKNDKKVLIVGLGLIGGSYAMALRDKGYEVEAIVRREETLEYAISNGIIKNGKITVDKDYIQSFSTIIFCLYPSVFLDWMDKYHSYIKDGSYLTDVTGVKSKIVYKVQEYFKNTSTQFVASHPMAGREVYGIENADASMFKNANFIVTPTMSNTSEAIERTKSLGEELGFKKVSILSPEEHDKMIAFLSQLTHVIAVSLMTTEESENLANYTGDSFRDFTRIANINSSMWTELFLLNKEYLLEKIDAFMNEMKEFRDALSNEDVETMKKKMELSTLRRSYFIKK